MHRNTLALFCRSLRGAVLPLVAALCDADARTGIFPIAYDHFGVQRAVAGGVPGGCAGVLLASRAEVQRHPERKQFSARPERRGPEIRSRLW